MRGRPRGQGRGPGRPRKEAAATGKDPSTRRQRNLRNRSCKTSGSTALRSRLQIVLEAVRSHEDAWLFAVPLDENICPGYYSIVKEPMDLTIIAQRAEECVYSCKEAFVADFKRMVENCAFYNGLQSEIATKGYRLWVTMLDALHTVCCDDEDDGNEDCESSSCGSGSGKSIRSSSSSGPESPANRPYMPEPVATPAMDAKARSRPGKRRPSNSSRSSTKPRPASRGGSLPRAQRKDDDEREDNRDDDFVALAVKRSRGRPPKPGRTRGTRRTASHASSRTRARANPALEALSMATRRALEDSADLTFDICRMSGDFEASSNVVGYYPDLNIAGTHSHPSELLERFRGSPEKSGGYTIAESSDAGSTGEPEKQCVSDGGTSKAGGETDDNDGETNETLAAGNHTDWSSESQSSVSEVPDATVVPVPEDMNAAQSNLSAVEAIAVPMPQSANTTRSSAVEAPVRMQEETIKVSSPDTSINGSHSAAQSDEPVEDVHHEGVKGGATGETALKNGHGAAILSASPFTASRHAYVQTSVATLPRCRSVPPLHFTPVLCRPTEAPKASSAAGSEGSMVTTNEDLCSAGPLASREERPGEVERRDDAHLIAPNQNAGGETQESVNNGSTVSGGATLENGTDECWRDSGACSDSPVNPAGTSAEAVGTDQAIPVSSAGRDAVALPIGACESAPQEQLLASDPAPGNVSPEHVRPTRDRWAFRGDLQMAEPDLYSGLDSPKSSFSFSSGYLSEEALSPTMRYHGSASPLPQLSPSRLSPLLPPTSCQPPLQQAPPAPPAEEAAEPPKESREAVLPEAKKSAPVNGVPTTRHGSVMTAGRRSREPSSPFEGPTPLQRMSALVSEIPPPAASHGACSFQSPFAPISAEVGFAGGPQRPDTTAFKPVSGQLNQTGVPYVARPLPTQPGPLGGPQRLPLGPQPEPIAYLIPSSSLGTLQAIPLRSDGALYDYHGGGNGVGVQVHWGYPQFFYYPAGMTSGPAQPTLFLPDVSPEAQRHALSSAPWLRARHQRLQQRHAPIHVVANGALDAACASAAATTAPASTKRAAPSRDKGKATAVPWQNRPHGTPYQVAQPLMVEPSGQGRQQQQHLVQSFMQQQHRR